MPTREFLQAFVGNYLRRLGPPLDTIRSEVMSAAEHAGYDVRLRFEVAYNLRVDRRDWLRMSQEEAARFLSYEIDAYLSRLRGVLEDNRHVPPQTMTFRDARGDLMTASSSDGTVTPAHEAALEQTTLKSLGLPAQSSAASASLSLWQRLAELDDAQP